MWSQKKKSVIHCLTIVLIIIFAGSGVLIFRELRDRHKVQKNFDNLAQQTQLEAPPGGEVSSSNDAVPPVEADEPIDAAVHKRDIAVLAAENMDCI